MVYDKVVSVIANQLDMDQSNIEEDSTFEIIGADEMDIAEIILTLEGEFEIEISDEDVLNIEGVSDLVELIEASLELE